MKEDSLLEDQSQENTLQDSSKLSSHLLDEERLNPDLLLQNESVIEDSEPLEDPVSQSSDFSFAESRQDAISETPVHTTIPQVESPIVEQQQSFVSQAFESQSNASQLINSQIKENAVSSPEEDVNSDSQLKQSQAQVPSDGKALNLDQMISHFSANES